MNLSLQSSLFAASVPAADTLSSYFRRLSSVAALPAHSSSSSCPPLSLHAGDVLEVHGGSNTGKSAVLLSCVLSCALPSSVLGLTLHGCDRSCAVIDCDGRLSVYRLQCMIEERCSKAWQQHWEGVASSSSGADPSAADELRVAASRSRRQAVALLTQLVLRRLRVVAVADEVELMAALLTIDRICEAEQGQQRGDARTVAEQRQQQMANIAPYLRQDKHRPPFHTRDEDDQQEGASTISHARSIASLPLPHPHSTAHSPASISPYSAASSSSSSFSLVSRYSPVSPLHSLSLHSPDPLSQAEQGAHHASAAAFPALSSDPTASAALPSDDQPATAASSSSVSDVLSALSSLCAACPPPVELLLVDNIAAFYFSAKSADKLSAASASSPASGPSAPSVYSSVCSRVRRLLADRQLAAVVTKPTLFAGSASSLQGEWRHSEYMPPDYAAMVRWRMLLRMKLHGDAMMDDDDDTDGNDGSHTRAALDGVDGDDSGGLRECRVVACRDEEANGSGSGSGSGSVGGVRQSRNTVVFHSTIAHNKEGIVFV